MAADPLITPAQFAQQLKDQLAIEQVIQEYVPSLNRRGSSWKGLCPFHNEKTPSFHVHPEHQFYHCFGCGAHGDVIRFVQEIEKIDFMLALGQLARRAGLPVPVFRGGGGTPRDEDRLAALRAACSWAEEFFIEQLRVHPRGALARDYLHRRGLGDEEIRHYRLGYAPDGYEVLLHAAEKRGYSGDLLAEAGLATRRDNGGFSDRFRDRVMFPIADAHGQVVAFGGRIIENLPDAAKYINSAETPLFRKSQLLYGLHAAREAVRRHGEVILLEGYMDWLMMHRSGITHVLAGMGTAFTPEQSRLLRRMTPRVTLLYDGDEAGRKAMLRSTEMLLMQGLEVHAAVLPAEHDPDSFLQAEGTQALRELLGAAPTAVDYFIRHFAETADLTRPEGKAEAAGRMAPLLLAIEDPALREGYLTRAAQRLGLRLETFESLLRRRQPRRVRNEATPAYDDDSGESPAEPAREPSKTEQYLLYILLRLREPWELLQRIDIRWIQDATLRSIFERFHDLHRDIREGAESPDDIFSICDEVGQKEWLSRILLLPERQFGGELPPADFDQELLPALEFQMLKLRRAWNEQTKRELAQDLHHVLGDAPLGRGHLDAIEKITRENLDRTTRFMNRD